jgi:hypothetical protein
LESLKNPRERDSILNFVNQQKIDAGFDVQLNNNKKSSNQATNKSSSVGISDLESNVSDTSDAATEVISYTNGTNSRPPSKSSNRSAVAAGHSRQATNSADHGDPTSLLSPRPGAQRAILEIASQMPSEDILEVIELLNQMRAQGGQIPIPSPSGYVSALPQGYHPPNPSPYSTNYSVAPTPSASSASHGYPPQKHPAPSPQGRRGKSGPPVLQTSNYIISEEDEEVTQHTKHNETYRLIPPLGSSIPSSTSTLLHTNPSTTPSTLHGGHQSKYYRSGSATSNASGTNSASNSRSSTPLFKKSPIPISLQHDICPSVNRDSNPSSSQRSADGTTPTLMKQNATPEVPNLVLPKSERIENHSSSGGRQTNNQKNSKTNSSSSKDDNGRRALLESLHSPRSAFDDRSFSSSSSNFTSASNRSGRSRGSSTVKGHPSTNSRKH